MEIPKKIHYCWFGEAKKNKLFDKCCKSWKKFFPDYEIIEWNEKNFDVNCNAYVKEAYKEKKFAFVSDYARLKIIYENGGIYFDTDVEVLKSFPKEVLENGYFAKETEVCINTGLGFSAEKGNKVIKMMMDDYEDIRFYKENGDMDLTPCTQRNTKSLIKRGYNLEKCPDKIENIKIYDREIFCGYDVYNSHYIITDKTITVHHYSGSWTSKKSRILKNIKSVFSNIIGLKNYDRIRCIKKKIELRGKNENKKK